MNSTHESPVINITPEKHPNADNLSIVKIYDSYTCVINTEQWKGITKAVYIQPDSMVDTNKPEFSFLKHPKGNNPIRVTVKKIRGIYSQGLLIPAPDWAKEGDNLAEYYNVGHYEPPMDGGTYGDGQKPPTLFASCPKYDIDTYRKYRRVSSGSETVNVTEKLNGCNARFVFTDNEVYVGGRNVWLKNTTPTVYWNAFRNNPNIEKFIRDNPNLMLYGEVYGQVKNWWYDCQPKVPSFRAFDICRPDFSFLCVNEFLDMTNKWNIPTVPQLGNIKCEFDVLESMAEGETTLGNAPCREGIVIKPLIERYDNKIGRVYLKLVGNGYLELK